MAENNSGKLMRWISLKIIMQIINYSETLQVNICTYHILIDSIINAKQ